MNNDVSLKNLFDLSGRVALVTGGCRNFGLEIASGLSEAGAHVIVTSRDTAMAERRAAELAEAWQRPVTGMGLELTDEASVTELFRRIGAEHVELDILVNNAGGHTRNACGWLERESLEGWRGFLEGNLTGTFLMLRAYARLMMPFRRGSVINIASISSLVGRDRSVYPEGMTPNPVAYTAAKAGVIGLTYDAAAYLGKWNIRVNAISPGGFARNQPESFIAEYSARTMLNRMGRPGRDLKGVAAFLASDAAAYVTGHNMVVDGGFTRYK